MSLQPTAYSLMTIEGSASFRSGRSVNFGRPVTGIDSTIRVLGIDPGLHITGYGLVEMCNAASAGSSRPARCGPSPRQTSPSASPRLQRPGGTAGRG